MNRALLVAAACTMLLAQTTLGQESSAPAEVQLLSWQINFLQNANALLAQNYERTLGFLKWLFSLAVGGSILAGGGVVYATLRRIRKDLDGLVREEVVRQVDQSIQGRVEHLERIVRREEVIGFTQIDYCRPGGGEPPEEYALIIDRGFSPPFYTIDANEIRPDSAVVVLDLGERNEESSIKADLDEALMRLGDSTVLVVYTQRRSEAVGKLSERVTHYTAANIPISLVSACVDSSHVAYALRKRHTSSS